jgi:hypothetical protein
MEFNSIFHAFSMQYRQIAELAPRLAAIGFSHVQFPPIQTTRQLSELDVELLQAQLKAQEIQLQDYERLCTTVNEKNKLYASHNFSYVLRKRIDYIRQPLLQDMHTFLLNGVKLNTVLLHMYHNTEYGLAIACALGFQVDVEMCESLSPIVKLIANIHKVGKSHPQHALLESIELLLKVSPYSFTTEDKYLFDELKAKLQTEIRLERTDERINLTKELTKEYRRVLQRYNNAEKQRSIYNSLKELIPQTNAIRSATSNRQPSRSKSFLKVALPAFNLTVAKHWLNVVTIAELLIYSPWWLIYQPVELAIGDTLLGTKEDILYAISACSNAGLSVISDIVVNNLAATPGERDAWKSLSPLPLSNTLLEVEQYISEDTIKKAKTLLKSAFTSDDLSLLTPPYECKKGQNPLMCWMSGALPQLNQNHPMVKDVLYNFLQTLKNAGVSGVRIDAAAHLSPDVCDQIIREFQGLSYIEYVGDLRQLYNVRVEDFAIGEDLYLRIFSEQAQYSRLKNYGSDKLSRVENADSVTMIINHDHVMGSIQSQVFQQLPSETTYELSVTYLIQRIYGSVLLMPHDLEFVSVQKALALRKKMKFAGVIHEHVYVSGNYVRIEKYNRLGLCFVVYINMNDTAIYTEHGTIEGYSFDYYALDPSNTEQVFNNIQNRSRRKVNKTYRKSRKTKSTPKSTPKSKK